MKTIVRPRTLVGGFWLLTLAGIVFINTGFTNYSKNPGRDSACTGLSVYEQETNQISNTSTVRLATREISDEFTDTINDGYPMFPIGKSVVDATDSRISTGVSTTASPNAVGIISSQIRTPGAFNAEYAQRACSTATRTKSDDSSVLVFSCIPQSVITRMEYIQKMRMREQH